MTLPGTVKLHHHQVGVPGPVTACTIRNPLDIMASWYAMYSRTPQRRKLNKTPDGKPISHLSMSVRPQPLVEFAATFAVQAFVGPDLEHPRMFYHLPTDEVIRYEYLQGDLDQFLMGLGLPTVEIGCSEATSGKKPWRTYYEAEPKAEWVVRGRFPLDFEEWEQRMEVL